MNRDELVEMSISVILVLYVVFVLLKYPKGVCLSSLNEFMFTFLFFIFIPIIVLGIIGVYKLERRNNNKDK